MKMSESSRETLAQAAALLERVIWEMNGRLGPSWPPNDISGSRAHEWRERLAQILAALQQAQAPAPAWQQELIAAGDALYGELWQTYADKSPQRVDPLYDRWEKARALAAAPPVAPAPAWQPIETHDGSRDSVLVAMGPHVCEAQYDTDRAEWYAVNTHWTDVTGGDQWWPKHWMPLPSPPGVAAAPPVAGTDSFAREREVLHNLLSDAYAALDIEAHRELADRISRVTEHCDEDGPCVPLGTPEAGSPAQAEHAGDCNPFIAPCGARFCSYEEMSAHVRVCRAMAPADPGASAPPEERAR